MKFRKQISRIIKILVPNRGWVSRHSTYFGGWVSQRCTKGVQGGWVGKKGPINGVRNMYTAP